MPTRFGADDMQLVSKKEQLDKLMSAKYALTKKQRIQLRKLIIDEKLKELQEKNK